MLTVAYPDFIQIEKNQVVEKNVRKKRKGEKIIL